MNRQKHLRFATAVLMATTPIAALPNEQTEAATTYKDVRSTDYFYKAVTSLSKQGAISGFADGTFKPSVQMTRGQIAVILASLLNLKATGQVRFADLATDHPFYTSAAAVVENGIMSFKQGSKFGAKDFVTRYELAQILQKAYKLEATSTYLPFKNIPKQYEDAVRAVYSNRVMNGVSQFEFQGNSYVTRAQVAQTIYNAQFAGEELENATKSVELTIENFTPSRIMTDLGKVYRLPANMQHIFKSANTNALEGANLKVKVVNGAITQIESIELVNDTSSTIYFDGGGGQFAGELIINANYVQLRNIKVPYLTIGDEADDEVTLENVSVTKRMTVEDGYRSDFELELKNSSINELIVNRDDMILNSTSKLEKVVLEDDVYDIWLNAPVGLLHLVTDSSMTLYGSAAIDRIFVPETTDLSIQSSSFIKQIDIENEDSTLYIEDDARIRQVTIPQGTDYENIISYYGTLTNYVERVAYKGSNQNLFALDIERPTREELAYQEAFSRAIEDYTSSSATNSFTVSTKFGMLSTLLADDSVDHTLRVTSGLTALADDAEIDVAVRYGSDATQIASKVTVAQLKNGVTLSQLLGESFTISDFSSGSTNSFTVTFDTPYAFTVASSLDLDGNRVRMTQAKVNKQYETAVANAIASFSATPDVNEFNTVTTFGPMSTDVGDALLDMKLTVTTAIEDTVSVPVIVKRGDVVLYTGSKTGTELKAGVKLSDINVPARLLSAQTAGATENFTIVIGVAQLTNVRADVLVANEVVKTENVTLTPNALMNAIEDFDVTATTQNTAEIKTKFGTIDETLLADETYDVRFTVTNGFGNVADDSDVTLTVFHNSGTLDTKTKKMSELKAGIKLSEFLTPSTAKKLTDYTSHTDDTWSITLDTDSPVELFVESLIDEDTVRTGEVILNSTMLTALEGSITSFTASADVASLVVNTVFASSIADGTVGSKTVDAYLIATTTAPSEETYAVTITLNETEFTTSANVTKAQLAEGVYLSTLLGGGTPAALSGHNDRNDTWKITVTNPDGSTIDAKVYLVLDGYHVRENSVQLNLPNN